MGLAIKKNTIKKIVGGFVLSIILSVAAAVCFDRFYDPPVDGVIILEYHRVADDESIPVEDVPYNVPPEEFAAQLDYLADAGYHTLTLLEYMKIRKGKGKLPEKPVVLTFDDGYGDNYANMLPILEARGMKAVLYMITNKIGTPDYLTWDELRDMQKRGVEIGSHTANHLPLTSLASDKQSDEVRLSKLLMEWNGINTVFSFSYPNGAYNAALPQLLERQEYLNAVTGDPGLNTADTDPFLLHRVNIPHPHFGLAEFRFRLFKAKLFYFLGTLSPNPCRGN